MDLYLVENGEGKENVIYDYKRRNQENVFEFSKITINMKQENAI